MRISFFTLILGFFISGCSTQIQKQINVTKNIRSVSITGYDHLYYESEAPKYLSYKCFSISISQADLNKMLAQDAKIITSTTWEQTVDYSTIGDASDMDTKGTCIGISYIVEGNKSLLDKYSAIK